ncbi:MAG: PAS domain-containing protein, partial [Arenicellales bacterium]
MLKQKEKDTINNIGIPTQILLDTLTEVPWGIAITERKESTNNIIFINHAFENMIACEAKVVVGQDWQILLGKIEDLHLPAKIHKAARDGKHCSVVISKPSQFGNGSYSYHELSVTPMCNESVDVTHLIWLMKDVTDQILKEAQLVSAVEKREERFAAYLDNANEAIWRIDFIPPIQLSEPLSQQVQKIFDNGVFAEANNAVARAYGLNVGTEVIGKPLNEFMEKTNPENIEQMIEYANNKYNMKNVITYEKTANGITRAFINNMFPGIEDNAVQYVCGASLD